jgi:hypothetical protein
MCWRSVADAIAKSYREQEPSDFGESFVVENFAFDSHPATLIMAQQDASLSQLFSEYRILGSQILSQLLLLTIHPPGDHNQGELPRLEDNIHDSPIPRRSNVDVIVRILNPLGWQVLSASNTANGVIVGDREPHRARFDSCQPH